MSSILIKLASSVLEKYLENGSSQSTAYAKLEKKYGSTIASKVWKAVTGKTPPAKPAATKKDESVVVTKPKTPTTKPKAVVEDEEAEAPAAEPATPASADDFAGITNFRNSADCSKWPVTVTISDVSFRGKNIAWKEAAGQREKRNWNVKTGKKSVNGECIFVIPSIKTAGMFDYLGVGQTLKTTGNIFPNPAKGEKGFFDPWVPSKGERIGFCIATISRDKNAAKMQERSNVIWFTWP